MSHQQKDGGKNHRIISIGAEEIFDKTQQPFIIKTFNKIEIEGNYFHIIKAIYMKSPKQNTLNGERLNTFLLRSGTRQEYIFTTFIQQSSSHSN